MRRWRHAAGSDACGPCGDGNVTVDMGLPRILADRPVATAAPLVAVPARRRRRMPNPHVVVPRVGRASSPRSTCPPAARRRPPLPDGQNVEFVVRRGPRQLQMRVHERGVGETRSCGTGICAAAVAVAAADGLEPTGSPWRVDVPGGTCEVTWHADGGRADRAGRARRRRSTSTTDWLAVGRRDRVGHACLMRLMPAPAVSRWTPMTDAAARTRCADDATGDYELEERQALRRVAGLSTELEDITEVEYRQLRLERVVLVGVWTGGTRRRGRELPRRAGPAGRDRGLPGTRRADPASRQAGPRDLHRLRQGEGAARHRPRRGRGHRDLRRRAHAGPAAPAGVDRQGEGRRPDRADPRHLRPARPVQGGQGAGRARPDAVPAAAPARLGRVAVAAGRWARRRRYRHRGPRTRRDQDRDRPPADQLADGEAAPRAGRR